MKVVNVVHSLGMKDDSLGREAFQEPSPYFSPAPLSFLGGTWSSHVSRLQAEPEILKTGRDCRGHGAIDGGDTAGLCLQCDYFCSSSRFFKFCIKLAYFRKSHCKIIK